ncbi:hypothetical protein [Nocardia asiatica]|uniref:hypothetical protein n=1 Tax=Nocardia asiatica TaxID=209252 RepID=UPI002455727E|nr:hypothetical protein [Nocardia asiatica]
MSDVSFPARIVVTEGVDDDGLPILTAVIVPADSALDDPLPAGLDGLQGPRGVPGTTFAKQGTIANAAARPTGLGADDRGKWWHRTDDNGMDVWDGSAWHHSPGAVGPQGPAAAPNTITVTTVHDPALTVPAVRFTGNGADQELTVTVPAGLQGPKGPAGASGSIGTADDFDTKVGPTQRSMFGYQLGTRKWQVLPPPNGFGPWSWYQEDFAANQQVAVSQLIAGTFTVPALPFRYRPLVFAQLHTYCQTGWESVAIGYVRLNNANGLVLATGALARVTGTYQLTPMPPAYGDEGTKPLGPNSTYATVPANTPAPLVVTVERVGNANSQAQIGYDRARASLTVWALPA